MAPRLRSAASSKADERLGLELEHVVYARAQLAGLAVMLPEARNKSHLIFGPATRDLWFLVWNLGRGTSGALLKIEKAYCKLLISTAVFTIRRTL